jgi:transitional endoplasmic reticulum ATPase
MSNKTSANLDELKHSLQHKVDEIRTKLGGKKDFNELPETLRQELRLLYTEAARMAKDVSQRATDQKQIEEYTAHAKFFTSRAQALGSVMKGDVPNTSFDDIKGLEKIKNLAKSFIFMARNSNLLKYYKIEGGLGLLMYGAPGTGKTMFAEAIAHEMNLPLFVVTPADIFKSYVGASEQAVREIFNEIDQCPDGAILFVDECESIFSMRTSDTKDYKSAVTTELLQRINGFGVDGSKRIMIGSTNRPDLIDSAYLRYKRFSHLIHVTPPDREAKDAIIRGKLKGIALEAGLTYEEILDMTEKTETVETENGAVTRISAYYSAADLCGALEEACRLALEKIEAEGLHNPIPVTRDMFKAAFTKIVPSISAELLEEYDNFRKNK